MSSPVNLLILDIPVSFPYPPYPVQVTYLNKVIEGLTTAKNALLESPTGTGKTMSLLCASLAWQLSVNSKLAAAAKIKIEYNKDATCNLAPPPKSAAGPSFIIYASRTHAQLQQVVQELKKTTYLNTKTVVLGSRDQLCVNDTLKSKNLKGAVLDQACGVLCNQHRCYFKNNLESKKKEQETLPLVADIEDAVAFGKRNSKCSYYGSREAANVADLILMPYNYLLDTTIRSSLRIEWTRAVVIFDEAHNLEEVASAAASFSLSTYDLSACVKELATVHELLAGHSSSSDSLRTDNSKESMSVLFGSSTNNSSLMPSPSQVRFLSGVAQRLEMHIEELPLERESGRDQSDLVKDFEGFRLLDIFNQCSMSVEKARDIAATLRKCADLLIDASLSRQSNNPTMFKAVQQPRLLLLTRAVEQLYKTHRSHSLGELRRITADYRVCVREERAAGTGASAKSKRVVNYFALCGGIAMEELRDLGIKTIIMTSGTLSPLSSFKEDMKLPFEVTLQNPHVINNKQLWVGCVSTGVNNERLNSNYESRNNTRYQDEVGRSIGSICNAMTTESYRGVSCPRVSGGVLVFFPSYGLMETMLERWKVTGILDSLRECCGAVVTETRSKTKNKDKENRSQYQGFKPPMKGQIIEEGYDSEDERVSIDNIVVEFNRALTRYGRCLLVAVCRGKVSEGIDFKDNRARTVIVVGIPFAPYLDARVVQKQKYLDEKCRFKPVAHVANPSPHNPYVSGFSTAKSIGGPVASHPLSASVEVSQKLSGREWYKQSAIRAVNQAIGRIIRHKKDWGAVFLLDERFQTEEHVNLLSHWIRGGLRKYFSCGPALNEYRGFLTACAQDSDLHIPSSIRSNCTSVLRPALSADAQFPRSIELSVADFAACSRGDTFVDLAVQLTQPTVAPSPTVSGSRTVMAGYPVMRSLTHPPPTMSVSSIANVFAGKSSNSSSSHPALKPSSSSANYSSIKTVTQSLLAKKAVACQAVSHSQPSILRQSTLTSLVSRGQLVVVPNKDASREQSRSRGTQDLINTNGVFSSQADTSQVGYRPSKRAKLMAGLSEPVTTSALSTNKNAFLHNAISKSSSSTSSVQPKAFQVVSSKVNIPKPSSSVAPRDLFFSCGVCHDASEATRAAAPCRHTCCVECWTKWLKISPTCPICREPASHDTIKRIYRKQ